MPSAGFEPAILAVLLSQSYALDRTATGIGKMWETSREGITYDSKAYTVR
jgi:hypothetical protein